MAQLMGPTTHELIQVDKLRYFSVLLGQIAQEGVLIGLDLILILLGLLHLCSLTLSSTTSARTPFRAHLFILGILSFGSGCLLDLFLFFHF